MSAANPEAQSSSDAPPFRQGALDAAAIRRECPQFRILIIGKANAGKTTILRKVCNAKPDGEHNIEYQLTYPGSNFIFHDSRGIEAGSDNELKVVKDYLHQV